MMGYRLNRQSAIGNAFIATASLSSSPTYFSDRSSTGLAKCRQGCCSLSKTVAIVGTAGRTDLSNRIWNYPLEEDSSFPCYSPFYPTRLNLSPVYQSQGSGVRIGRPAGGVRDRGSEIGGQRSGVRDRGSEIGGQGSEELTPDL